MTSSPKTCVIVGAGIAGLTAAGILRDGGQQVVLLDKGHSAGGRMATRQVGQSRFDHGAQFFTVRDARFQQEVDKWVDRGWATPWFSESGHLRYRGTDGMNGIARELSKQFDLRTGTRVERIWPWHKGWRILTAAGDEFSATTVLLTAPAPQAIGLLSGCLHLLPAAMTSVLNSIRFDPCFALLVILDGQSRIPAPGYIRLDSGPVAFIADNVMKGVSGGNSALTIHARADFSRSCFESLHEEIAGRLLDAASPWIGTRVLEWRLHRWKYSQPVSTAEEPHLFTNEPAPLAFAGDAFGGPRIEGAFLSGLTVSQRIKSGR